MSNSKVEATFHPDASKPHGEPAGAGGRGRAPRPPEAPSSAPSPTRTQTEPESEPKPENETSAPSEPTPPATKTRFGMSDPDNIIVLRPDGSIDPIQDTTPTTSSRLYCKARTRQGRRCGNPPVRGATVCRMHGGAAPQVKNRARIRLLELVDPAVATLAREMTGATNSADRQRAANSILDRAGVVRQNGPDVDLARTLLIDRLLTLKEQGQ